MSLVIAGSDGDLDRVKAAVSGGEDIDGRDSEWNTALHEACRKGHVDIVKYLLDNGANTELKGFQNFTPLQVACKYYFVISMNLRWHGITFVVVVRRMRVKQREGETGLQSNYGVSTFSVP